MQPQQQPQQPFEYVLTARKSKPWTVKDVDKLKNLSGISKKNMSLEPKRQQKKRTSTDATVSKNMAEYNSHLKKRKKKNQRKFHIPEAVFRKVVKEIVDEVSTTPLKVQLGAYIALQTEAEEGLAKRFAKIQRLATLAQRETIMDRDSQALDDLDRLDKTGTKSI